ncbi:MAG TPA: APC family permease [Dehalococcoidia bacterium]|nr:APC family permease [Dehalococcoidia bacterium]
MDSSETPPRPPEDNGRTVVRLQRRRDGEGGAVDGLRHPEPELHETVRGKTGSRFLRLTRAGEQKLRRVAENEFEATKVLLRPATRPGRMWSDIRHFFIGEALATSELSHQRLSKVKALAIFSSDNLSSSAYATEEILLVLILAGTAALTDAIPIALAIGVLAAIVATSYRQTIRAYPNGGGAYVVAKENLGLSASLIAGSALFVDYVLTVAVSTAAGVAAITSALPELHDLRIEMAIGFVALLTLGNLRGIRESGTIFAIPTYFFIFVFGGMLVFGGFRLLIGDDLRAAVPEHPVEAGAGSLTIFLLLRAFASGCAALTGIEAIANGVPYFKPPEAKNASTTLVWMAIILFGFFLGATLLAHQFGIVPAESKTVVAQIAATVFGGGSPFFYAVQVATALILILAANTSFAGLPAAASVMARDSVMPKQFAFRGDRLAFSNGILVVGILSSVLLVAFDADTHKLIPLYAFGVFTAFTLSQAGMIVHWRRDRGPGWRSALLVNAIGATATGVVAVIIGATKFSDGAWLSMAFMAILAIGLLVVHRHYNDAADQLSRGLVGAGGVAEHFYTASAGRPQTVIVPVENIDRAVLRTIAYARTLSPNAVAVHVTDEHDAADRLRAEWELSIPDMPLVVVESPYRSLVEPLLAYIEGMDRTQPNQVVTVVLPEFIPKHFWQKFLHNQLPLRLKKALVNRPNTVLVDVPYHLR